MSPPPLNPAHPLFASVSRDTGSVLQCFALIICIGVSAPSPHYRACMLKAIDAVREGVAPAHTIPSLQFSRSDGYGAEVTPTAFLMTSGPTPINLYIADFSLVKGNAMLCT